MKESKTQAWAVHKDAACDRNILGSGWWTLSDDEILQLLATNKRIFICLPSSLRDSGITKFWQDHLMYIGQSDGYPIACMKMLYLITYGYTRINDKIIRFNQEYTVMQHRFGYIEMCEDKKIQIRKINPFLSTGCRDVVILQLNTTLAKEGDSIPLFIKKKVKANLSLVEKMMMRLAAGNLSF